MSPSSLRGGCIIVDSTRKGKRFPDSMSKTIPIWTCVLNRAIHNYKRRLESLDTCDCHNQSGSSGELVNPDNRSSDWDCSLHLPLWVSNTEKEMINRRLEGWNTELEASGADMASIALALRKPLRPLWISQKTVIWLNEVPEYDSWDFTPIILVSGSSSSGSIRQRTTSEFSWNYIAGAGDDEESWARGLSPDLFWKHATDIISSGPDLCNQKVASIVEKDRVCRAQRGEDAPQLFVRPSKSLGNKATFPTIRESVQLDNGMMAEGTKSSYNDCISFLGTTNIAVCKSQIATKVPPACCLLNCEKESFSVPPCNPEMYLHLPILDSKFDRFSLLRNLPSALSFARSQLRQGNALLICCCNGEDISICVCLAVFTSFYDEAGSFDDGRSLMERRITKLELRRRLVFVCKYIVNARPSRGNLKQVFACLSGEHIPVVP